MRRLLSLGMLLIVVAGLALAAPVALLATMAGATSGPPAAGAPAGPTARAGTPVTAAASAGAAGARLPRSGTGHGGDSLAMEDVLLVVLAMAGVGSAAIAWAVR